jgi:hypothetical protein
MECTIRLRSQLQAGQLSDEEVTAVINHERKSWGNNTPATTTEAVATVQRKGKL